MAPPLSGIAPNMRHRPYRADPAQPLTTVDEEQDYRSVDDLLYL